MQTSTRSLLSAAVITAAAALAPHAAHAASATVNVPFSFTASGKQCPAGAYQVRLEQMNQVVRLSNARGHIDLVWLAGPGNPAPNAKRVVLLFDRAGDSHVLRSVQDGDAITARLDQHAPAHEQLTEVVGQ